MTHHSEPLPDWVPPLLAWFKRHQRILPWRSEPTPYRVLVSEFMLQQTQVATVIPYFERFMRAFPTLADLAAADQAAVLKQWEGLGYYARARRLQECARMIMAQGGEIPADPAELARLPGIGLYTAAAIASIAFGRSFPVVDGNVLRVRARLLADPADQSRASIKRQVYNDLLAIIRQVDDPSAFNQALMEISALVCQPRQPRCAECPLQNACRAVAEGAATAYPRRPQTKVVPHYHVAVGLIFNGDRLLIMQRSTEQMLGGLWEFPGGKLEQDETPVQAVEREVLEETGLQVQAAPPLALIRHAYSHFRMTMHVCRCTLPDTIGEILSDRPHHWVKREELNAFPFPTANHKIFALPAFVEAFNHD